MNFPGGDNNLRVIVSQYDPGNLRCYGVMRRENVAASCEQILSTMNTDDAGIFFGPSADPNEGGVRLPYLLLSSEFGLFSSDLYSSTPIILLQWMGTHGSEREEAANHWPGS